MIPLEFTIKNYRCFSDSSPARFVLRPGFTAFVGPNNSGKSALLKFFFELRTLFQNLGRPDYLSKIFGEKGIGGLSVQGAREQTDAFHDLNGRPLSVEIVGTADSGGRVVVKVVIHRESGKNPDWSTFFEGKWGNFVCGTEGEQVYIKRGTTERDYLNNLLHSFQAIADSIFIGPYRNALNSEPKDQHYDILVGRSFLKQWRTIRAGTNKHTMRQSSELLEEIRSIFDYQQFNVDVTEDGNSLLFFVDNNPYRMDEIGSGITQILMVLATALARQPQYVFIDEPELHLHPSLQARFLSLLASYSTYGIAYATHNMGLSRTTAEHIYAVQRVHGDRVSSVRPLEAVPNLSELLGEMSFAGYREMGFDKLLLVEGATDVRTIQQFLRLYGKDNKVVLVPLGGSALIRDGIAHELEELKRLSDDVVALIDSERNDDQAGLDASRTAFVAACSAASIHCHVLHRRATENYFTTNAIQDVFGPKYVQLGLFERLEDAQMPWSKTDNWKIAARMTKQDLRTNDLHTFFDGL
jgi:ABC-type cobalamin/Fe3+-siderophores transport system ATPase subunit